MDLKKLQDLLAEHGKTIPVIKTGIKVSGVIVKKIDTGVIMSCENGAFTGIIMTKEVRDLERSGVSFENGVQLQAEILSTDILHEEGYYVVSVTKLLQQDVWKSIKAKIESDEILTVIPTEANLGGLLVDMHGIKWFIPLSQLAPIHYPRVEDGDQEKIFDKLIQLIGHEIQVRVMTIDEDARRIILSEREALKEEREKVMAELEVGKVFNWVISGISSYGLFVTIGGSLEGLVHISEITYWHVDNVDKFGKVGDAVEVKIISLDGWKISLSIKQVKQDPWSVISKKFRQWDVVQGEVVRFVPYGAFIRMFDDINGLVHITEMWIKQVFNPAEALKLWQVVKAKLITLDIKNRKIGLSVKAVECEEKGIPYEASRKPEEEVAAPVAVVPPVAVAAPVAPAAE